jgi:PD-(D/E)XK nuclease superfamily
VDFHRYNVYGEELLKFANLSGEIIKCFYEVYNELGRGFLESVYQNAMMIKFQEIFIPTVKKIIPEHEAQLLNYLRATKIEVGLILNFGDEPTYSRKIYDNKRKK